MLSEYWELVQFFWLLCFCMACHGFATLFAKNTFQGFSLLHNSFNGSINDVTCVPNDNDVSMTLYMYSLYVIIGWRLFGSTVCCMQCIAYKLWWVDEWAAFSSVTHHSIITTRTAHTERALCWCMLLRILHSQGASTVTTAFDRAW